MRIDRNGNDSADIFHHRDNGLAHHTIYNGWEKGSDIAFAAQSKRCSLSHPTAAHRTGTLSDIGWPVSVSAVTPYLFCASCKARNEPTARFCDWCGNPVRPRQSIRIEFGPNVIANDLVPHRILGTFRDYVLLDECGRGGMGVVYRAMGRASGQVFALKVLNARMGLNRSAVSILQNEAHAQSSIVHPNVVRVFEFVPGNRTSAIVMEFVEGPNVEHFVHRRPSQRVEPREAAWLAMHMANGLAVVHHQGLVHADVKAANFLFGTMYGNHTVLKVADFGIARSLKSELKLRAGTPGYMSPEQIRGDHLTASSDIYSLGCVLYELLAGRPVFPGQTTEEIHHHHLSTPVPDLSSAAPPHLTQLLHSMLAKSPQHRIQSMLAIVEALRTDATPPKEFK